jgi:AraC-like DNA-binding protein
MNSLDRVVRETGGINIQTQSSNNKLDVLVSEIFDSISETFLSPLQSISKTVLYISGKRDDVNIPIKRELHPFCNKLCNNPQVCKACQNVHRELRNRAKQCNSLETMVCSLGLTIFSLALRVDSKIVGFLEGGMVFTWQPDLKALENINSSFFQEASPEELAILTSLYLATPTVSSLELDNLRKLIHIISPLLTTRLKEIIIPVESIDPVSIQKAKIYIRQNLFNKLPISSIAAIAGVSESHFTKIFKRSTGISCIKYIMELRIHEARNLLLNSSKNISEIAYSCGFESISHFNRSFKKHFQVSPKDYRKFRNTTALEPRASTVTT